MSLLIQLRFIYKVPNHDKSYDMTCNMKLNNTILRCAQGNIIKITITSLHSIPDLTSKNLFCCQQLDPQ